MAEVKPEGPQYDGKTAQKHEFHPAENYVEKKALSNIQQFSGGKREEALNDEKHWGSYLDKLDN
jgi:hypothetical protein